MSRTAPPVAKLLVVGQHGLAFLGGQRGLEGVLVGPSHLGDPVVERRFAARGAQNPEQLGALDVGHRLAGPG